MKRLMVVVSTAAALAGCLAAAGGSVESVGGDPIGFSKLVSAKGVGGGWTWQDGAAFPNAETDYVIRHFTRTPQDQAALTFGGRSLTLAPEGVLAFKCQGEGVRYTFPQKGFVAAGGVLAHLAPATRVSFKGTFTVTAPADRPAVFRPAPDIRTCDAHLTSLAIEDALVASEGAMLRVTSDRSRKHREFENWGVLEVNGDTSAFFGTLDVRDYGVVFLNGNAPFPGKLALGPNGCLGVTNLAERTVEVSPTVDAGFWVGFDPKSGRSSCVIAPGLKRAGALNLVLVGQRTVSADCAGRMFGPLLKVPSESLLKAEDVRLTVIGHDLSRLPRFRIVSKEEAGMRAFFAEGCALTNEERQRAPLHVWMDEEPDQTWTVTNQYPEVPEARRALLFRGNEANGSYNHHAHVHHAFGRFHATWSNQRYDEDGPGQRVLYASSEDGVTWSAPRELVPALSPEAPWGKAPGVFCQSGGFVEWNGRLFGTGSCTEIISWENGEKTRSSPVYTTECGFPVYAGRGGVIREIRADGTFGPLLSRLRDVRPEILMRPIPEQAKELPAFRFPEPAFAWNANDAFRQLPDRRLCEQIAWKTPQGRIVGLFRDDLRSGFKWMSFSDDGFHWTRPRPTDIHDAPSLSMAMTLRDGTTLLFGNHRCLGKNLPGVGWRDRDPLMVSVSRDGIHFSGTHAVREGVYRYTVFPGPRCRGGSAQYPHAIEHEGRVYVIYSLGKESIELTSFSLAGLLASSSKNSRKENADAVRK